GRGSVPPHRFGPFLVRRGDRPALQYLLDHQLAACRRRDRLERWLAGKALDRGFDRIALAALVRRYGREAPGPLEVQGVWVAVRDTLKSCGLSGVRIGVHKLTDPAGGLGYGAVLIGFGRRGNALEADHPIVVLKVRPESASASGFAEEAQALAAVRAPLPKGLRDLIPVPLAHRSTDEFEVLATGYVPGRSLPLDLTPDALGRIGIRRRMIAVAATLARLQVGLGHSVDRVADGSVWPEAAGDAPWSRELRERLAVRPLPLMRVHGGFGPENILCKGHRITGVVGWSHHRSAALPTEDLFHFLLSFAHLVDRRSRGGAGAIRRVFVERNRVSRAVRDALLRYGEQRELGLPTLDGLLRLHLLVAPSPGGTAQAFRTMDDRLEAVRVLENARETVFTP
ncbi:MAG: hypothetical protein KJP18_16855, partial [Gemmatimonadetes bacterium]|nr:hypothetical protein [Gemmatimonadota bacterium]